MGGQSPIYDLSSLIPHPFDKSAPPDPARPTGNLIGSGDAFDRNQPLFQLVELQPRIPSYPREFVAGSKSGSKSANSHFSAPLPAGSTSQAAQFIVDGHSVGHNLTLGPRITEKKSEKWRWYGCFGGGSAYFNASDRLHFFQASACGRDMSHLVPQA